MYKSSLKPIRKYFARIIDYDTVLSLGNYEKI